MRKHLVLVAAVAAAAALLAAFGPGLAGAPKRRPPAPPTRSTSKEVKGAAQVRRAETTVTQGDELKIVNETNPKKVGPHTFSLVTKGSLPKTAGRAQELLHAETHLPLDRQMARRQRRRPGDDQPGQSRPRRLEHRWAAPSKKGDSWFTGEKKGASFTQQVTADPATTKTIYFMCAIHPWMQGTITVLPAGS